MSKCEDNACSSQTDPLSFALFVWDVGGLDIAVAVVPPNDSCYGHLNMAKAVYGTDPTDDRNGSIDWHTVVAAIEPAKFETGSCRPYQVRYLVGTLEQLAKLGYQVGQERVPKLPESLFDQPI